MDSIESSSITPEISCGGGLDQQKEGLDLSTNSEIYSLSDSKFSCGGALDRVLGGLDLSTKPIYSVVTDHNIDDEDCLPSLLNMDISSPQHFDGKNFECSDEPIPVYHSKNFNVAGYTAAANEFQSFSTPPSPDGRSVKVSSECRLGLCTCSHQLNGVKYQLKPCRFAALMFNQGKFLRPEDKTLFHYIIDGFPIIDDVITDAYECENYKSILLPECKEAMNKIIQKELSENMISFASEKPVCIHALGAVPKQNGGIRPITDCSRPLGRSVNNHSSSLVQPFHYMSIDNVTEILECGDFMSVIDIKSAYRAVCIRPEHRKYLGFKWEIDGVVRTFCDNRLCFGLRTGPCHFNMISVFIARMLYQMYDIVVIHYLDDFLCKGSSFEECIFAQNCVINIIRFLGFYISWDKVSSPCRVTKYLGILVDSERMELRLPPGKLEKIQVLLDQVKDVQYISKKLLEKLTGYLAHCALIVKGGRIFCRRLYDLYKVMLAKNIKRIRMSSSAKEDILWWSRFALCFNGKAAIANELYPTPMISDSSLKGFGVYLGNDWAIGSWYSADNIVDNPCCSHIENPPSDDQMDWSNINVLELWPIMIGLRRWYKLFKNKSVRVIVDNTQVKYMLRNGVSINAICMIWLREIFWICVLNNIQLIPEYISTKENIVADALSRIPYGIPSDWDMIRGELSQLCCSEFLMSIFSRSGGNPS